MDSQGKKSRKPCLEECNFDGLSPLPDNVLHHILSFIDCLDVVRTCVLSKRWRNVWKSVPCLNFDISAFTEHNRYSEFEYEPELELELEPEPESETESESESESKPLVPCYKFWDFIKWVLLLRDESRIRRINLTFDHTMRQQLNALLCFAGRKKVQELCFRDGDYTNEGLNFPSEVCETLESLTIEFHDNISLRVAKAFSSLKRLFLSGVVMSGDAAEKFFSRDCVELEDVHLEDIRVKDVDIINISADKLKNLKISNIYRREHYVVVNSFYPKLNICAPNLVSFSYLGPMLHGFSILDTVSLQHVSIRISHIPKPRVEGSEDLSPFTKCLVGLKHAKTLTLSSHVVKQFSPTYFYPLGFTFILDNLKIIMLGVRGNVDCIEGLINLLKVSPNLESLVIKFHEVCRFSKPKKQPSRGIVLTRHFQYFNLERV
ncbi:hypothetical protein ACJIZ3_011265 [Penstemon smallii]|uniref:F-box domain-containing protein n=1 Tax=Penstemon smallii TaxID=265156 RepID=A0ABD3ULH1_9LAMI